MSNREIAKLIDRSESTIRRFIKKWKETGWIYWTKERIGRKRLISEREEKLIVRTMKRQRTISSQDIKEFTEVNASAKTIKRGLQKYCYASRIAKKKPFISKKNRKARLKFTKKHKLDC